MIPEKSSFLDEQITSNLKKFKVYQEYELITTNGNCFKYKTFKLDGNYYCEIYRQNNINSKYYYHTGLGYIVNKKRLKERLICNWIYDYNNL